jgi:hypothetical protein
MHKRPTLTRCMRAVVPPPAMSSRACTPSLAGALSSNGSPGLLLPRPYIYIYPNTDELRFCLRWRQVLFVLFLRHVPVTIESKFYAIRFKDQIELGSDLISIFFN